MCFSTTPLLDRWKISFVMGMIDGNAILGSLGNVIDTIILVLILVIYLTCVCHIN